MSRVVLLTGGTGFVGRQVFRALSEQGARVRAVVRTGSENRLLHLPCALESVVSTSDMFAESADWWAQVCQSVDTVVHVAWYAVPGQYLHSSKNIDCLAGTLQLARGAVKASVRRIVGIGSCFEYDLTGGTLSVDTPLRPLTPYGAAKAAAFMALSGWLPVHDIEFSWCRLFYLYGEGEDPSRLIPYVRECVSAGRVAELSSGHQIRDYLEVSEAGRRIVAAALGGSKGPNNICSGIPVTVRELAERVADEYGRRDLLSFGARPENANEPPFVLGVEGAMAK